MGPRHDVQAAVLQVGIDQRHPHRDHRVGAGLRPVRLVLVPRHRPSGKPSAPWGRVLYTGLAKISPPIRRLHGIENDRVGHQLEVAGDRGPANCGRTSGTPRRCGPRTAPPGGSRTGCPGACPSISPWASRSGRDHLHLARHRLSRGPQVGIAQQLLQNQVALAVVEGQLLACQAAVHGSFAIGHAPQAVCQTASGGHGGDGSACGEGLSSRNLPPIFAWASRAAVITLTPVLPKARTRSKP